MEKLNTPKITVTSHARQQGKSLTNAMLQAGYLCEEISLGYRSHGAVSGRAVDSMIHDEVHLMHESFEKVLERAFGHIYIDPTKTVFNGNFKRVKLTYTNGSEYHFKGQVTVQLQKEKDGSETLIVRYSDSIKLQELPEGITVETPSLVGRVAKIPRKLVKELRTTNTDGSETIYGKAAL